MPTDTHHDETRSRVTSAEAAQSPGPDGSPVDTGAMVAALDLLAHWWSRPVADEVSTWLGAAELETEIRRRLSTETGSGLAQIASGNDAALALLDEYERLFVGPGPVPCPPYESFWRQDVAVDIRRSLMGPCTADLRRLYGQLEIEVNPGTGELPDHISVELEALGYALSFEGTDSIAGELFWDHLRQWLPRLARAVAHEAEHPFYRELAAVTAEWLGHVQGYFELVREARPGRA